MSLGGLMGRSETKRTLGNHGGGAGAGKLCVGGVLGLLHNVICVVLLVRGRDDAEACGQV